MSGLQEASLLNGGAVDVGDAQMLVCALGGNPAPRCTVQEAELEKVGFVYVLDSVGLLADGRSNGVEAHGTAVVVLDDGA